MKPPESVKSIDRLRINPGDTLILRVPEGLQERDMEGLDDQIGRWMKSEHPGTPGLVLPEGFSIYTFPIEALEALYKAAFDDYQRKNPK